MLGGHMPPSGRSRLASLTTGVWVAEAVIVSAARSRIGRAHKGSLRQMRAGDLAVQIVRAAVDTVLQLDPTAITDRMLGCGLPSGEQR